MFLENLPICLFVLGITCFFGIYVLWRFYDVNWGKVRARTRVRPAATVGGSRRRGGNIGAHRRPAARMRHAPDDRLLRREPSNEVEDSRERSTSQEGVGNTPIKKKVGTKKAAKLAEKERRKEEREAEERYRETQRKIEEQEIQKRKKEEEAEEKEAAAIAAAEAKQQEEEAARELAEYESIKQDFSVEELACTLSDSKAEAQLNAEILDAIEKSKVIPVEHLAVMFDMKVEVCVEKLKNLLSCGRLTGVLDDRGKFVHITNDEYEYVARFIEQRGRVTLAELRQNEHNLIRLNTALRC